MIGNVAGIPAFKVTTRRLQRVPLENGLTRPSKPRLLAGGLVRPIARARCSLGGRAVWCMHFGPVNDGLGHVDGGELLKRHGGGLHSGGGTGEYRG